MRLKKHILFALCNLISLVFLSSPLFDSTRVAGRKPLYRSSNKRTTDIIHTKLSVKFDWEKSQLTGEALILARPYFYPESKIYLDARGMEIQSVEVFEYTQNKNAGKMVDGVPAAMKLNSSYKYINDSVGIDLGRKFNSNEKFYIKIKYVAKPNEVKGLGSAAITDDKGLYFINPKNTEKNKMPQVWTQGETQSNSVWFPTVDSPNEKMTNEIFMTVEDKFTTLSNGLLNDSKKNGDGTRTDHWVMDQPHSPYLVLMCVGEFKKVTDSPWKGKEISYYVEKEYEPYAKQIFGDTKEMIEFYSNVLGTPYPWQKYSQIVVRDYVSGSMENTSATLHGDFMVYQNPREMLDGKKGEDVIAHELFHQWFGDLVTAESWSNLPLNESFATYGEYLWLEYKHGRDAAEAHAFESREEYFQSAENKQVEMIRYHYNDKEDMFDAFSYNKGGLILHMLRKYVGDEAFFTSLKLYLEKNKFKSAEIHDLRLAFEEITGEDLNWFFNQWFLAKGHPQLNITKEYDGASKILKLKVRQIQNLKEAPLYKLPVEVDIYSEGKVTRKRIVITDAEQEFVFNAGSTPQLVNFDAERQLLGRKIYEKSIDEYIFQYKNAPLYGDRLESLYKLENEIRNEKVYEIFCNAASSDKWNEIRIFAINSLRNRSKDNEVQLKPLMMKIVKEDKNNHVKGTAISFLGLNYKGAELEELFSACLNDSSYVVLSSALHALTAVNGPKAISAADKFKNEKNPNVVNALAFVYSAAGSDSHIDFFSKRINDFKGYEIFEFLYYYFELVKKCENVSSYETLFSDLITLRQSSNESVSAFADKLIREDFLKMVEKKASSKAGDQFKILKTKVEESTK